MTAGVAVTPLVESRRHILTAMAIALAIAVAVVVVAVLPAEYGVDVTGAGRALGLLEVYAAQGAVTETLTPPPEGPVFARTEGYRTDQRTFTVSAYGTLEFKYQLGSGAAMLYEWTASDPVGFDFHTEPAANPDAGQSFEKGEAAAKRGAYVAPYDGIHGWYWKNNADHDVTITLVSAGFYSSGKLFQGGGAGEDVVLTGGR
jgi:hypothetical protein